MKNVNCDNKWNELKKYILSEKEKITNSDDIPRSIYEDILNKMEELSCDFED